MYQKLMHNKSLRLIGGLLGGLLLSVAINVFIVPQGLYGGGAYGLCQVIRTLLQRELSLSLPFDLAGVLYFFVNIPLFLLAYKALGREFFWKAAICTVCNSVFLAVIPSPSTPVIPDILTSCMVGGILAGFVTSFITAAVELSATILLASAQSQAPMSYGIYLYMQSISGRGPGAALGVLAVVVVGLGTYFSHRFVERSRTTVQAKQG